MRKIVAIALLFPCLALAADNATRIDQLLQQYHRLGLLNGVVLVADHGKVIYRNGFGYANMEWQIPNTTEGRFRIGSVTKPFTAMLALKAAELGKLDLNAPILKYIPEYRADNGSKVLVRHLLSHDSGIPTYIGADIEKWTSPIPSATFIRQYCSGDLEFQPGTQFSYNNCGYYLLAAIVERATGRKYADLLRDWITGPAGMNNTGVDNDQSVLSKRAYGYEKNYLFGAVKARYTDMGTAFGAGDLYSTVDDLFLLDRALDTDKILSAQTRQKMFTPAQGPVALGWFVSTAANDHPAAGDTIQRHEGNIFGFFTMLERIPARQALVVVIDNTHEDAFDDIIRDVLAILYNKPYTAPKTYVAGVLAQTLLRDGATAAVKQYDELRSSAKDSYQWTGLNSLGNDLLQAGRASDAMEIFRLSIDNTPNSWYAHFNLAEAAKAAGKLDLSDAEYDKALKLNTAKAFGRMIEAARASRVQGE